MGNRAVVVFESMPEIGIYVHWNGGPESILAFLDETKRRGARDPETDSTYSFARLVQTMTDFFTEDSGFGPNYDTCIGVGPIDQLDTNGDNGTYYIGADFEITRRKFTSSRKKKLASLNKDEKEKYNGMRAQLELLSARNSKSLHGVDEDVN